MKKHVLSAFAAVIMIFAVMLCFASCKSPSNGEYAETKPIPQSDESGSGAYGNITDSTQNSEKIIKSASVRAETKDYDKAAESLKAVIAELSCRIDSSDERKNASYGSSDHMYRSGQFTIKVPVDNYDALLERLDSIYNVTSSNTSTTNATEEYYDLKAVIETLTSKRNGLTAMLENTNKDTQWSTWKQINSELTEVEIQLARYQAQMNRLEKQVSYSTVSLTVTEVLELTDTESESYGSQVGNAFKDVWKGTVSFFKGLLIVLIYLLPVGVIGGGIAVLIVFIVRKNAKKRITKTEQKPSSNNSDTSYGSYK